MTWGSRARRAAQRARDAARTGGARVQRVVAQQADRARATGRQVARRVVGAQLGAGLDSAKRGPLQRESPKDVMRRSAQSVVEPEGDRAWREGYRQVAAGYVPEVRVKPMARPVLRVPAIGQRAEPETDVPEAGS
jgi:hypothetical protein